MASGGELLYVYTMTCPVKDEDTRVIRVLYTYCTHILCTYFTRVHDSATVLYIVVINMVVLAVYRCTSVQRVS